VPIHGAANVALLLFLDGLQKRPEIVEVGSHVCLDRLLDRIPLRGRVTGGKGYGGVTNYPTPSFGGALLVAGRKANSLCFKVKQPATPTHKLQLGCWFPRNSSWRAAQRLRHLAVHLALPLLKHNSSPNRAQQWTPPPRNHHLNYPL
jgi:hypothetical protein